MANGTYDQRGVRVNVCLAHAPGKNDFYYEITKGGSLTSGRAGCPTDVAREVARTLSGGDKAPIILESNPVNDFQAKLPQPDAVLREVALALYRR